MREQLDRYPFHVDSRSIRISDVEIVVQKTCLRTLAIQFPQSRVAAIPNAGKRSRWEVGRVRSEGLSKGFPDLMVVGPNGAFGEPGKVAFIEIKAKTSLTPEQRGWMEFLHHCGHHCGVFRSDKTLEDKLRQWGFR